MLFNSLQYLVFFPIVVAFYFLLPPRRRWILLLGASYYFYMCWKAEYVFLILASTVIDYVAGLRMARRPDRGGRRKWLVLSLLTNLGLLFAFKYFNFFGESARQVFEQLDVTADVPTFDVLLPVGISFYTFQTLSYTISVYRGDHEPERHFGIFALYVSFFPQLVAGPIERSKNLLPQLREKHEFSYDAATNGLKLIAWGLFKKVVIADRVAVVVNTVYASPHEFGGAQHVIATVLFAYQIYCDFSGYSDIAIGSAQVMGYRLMKNFERPYYAKSISEFWKRWHISLSTWFRDYVYIPLGGSRVRLPRWGFNLMVTFLVSGLWHGANWTFVVWGGLNGLYLVLETALARPMAALRRILRLSRSAWRFKIPAVATTFGLTCFAWIFFRADSLSDALHVARSSIGGVADLLGAGLTGDLAQLKDWLLVLGLPPRELWIAFASIVALEAVHLLQRPGRLRERLARRPRALRWALYYLVVAACVFLGAFNQSQQFIYFQF